MGTTYTCPVCGWAGKQRSYCIPCHEKQAEKLRQEREHNHKRQMAEMKSQREQDEQKHKTQMENLVAKHEADAKAERTSRVNSAISSCKSTVARLESGLFQSRAKRDALLQKSSQDKSDLATLENKLSNFWMQHDKKSLREDLDVDNFKNKVVRCDQQIAGTIEKTCVHESNIGRFLRLVQYLTIATMGNQTEIDRLASTMSVFYHLVSREATGNVSIEYYFGDKMAHVVSILAKEEFYDMEDIICEGDEKGEEFQEIMEVIDNGLKAQHEEWCRVKKERDQKGQQMEEPEPKLKLGIRERRVLKNACLRPETWQDLAESKKKLLKKRLDTTSPVLSDFFGNIYKAMTQVQEILQYDIKLNGTQLQAIDTAVARARQGRRSARTITAEPEQPAEPALDEKEDVAVATDFESDEMKLQRIADGLDGAAKMTLEHSVALRDAAVCSINVMESMSERFLDCGDVGATASGLAGSVEVSCVNIVKAQASIRQSIVLAQDVSNLKPAKMTEQAKPLWRAVDAGVFQIYQNALNLNRVCAQYFAFFLRFRQAFAYYTSAKNESLKVSTEQLHKDIKQFGELSEKFNKQVAALSTSAMECIKACVDQTIGAEAFEKVHEEREGALRRYLKVKNEYDTIVAKWNAEFDEIFAQKTKAQAQVETNDLIKESLDKQIEYDEKIRQSTLSTINKLIQTKAEI